MRSLRTGGNTEFAAYAFGLVDYPDIAVGFAYMACPRGTILYTQRRYALPTHGDHHIVRVLGKGRCILDNLDPGQRGMGLALVRHGAGKHATLAAHASFGIYNR